MPELFLLIKECPRRCHYCGKFISNKEMEEKLTVGFYFIPDSEISIEESFWYHKKCGTPAEPETLNK